MRLAITLVLAASLSACNIGDLLGGTKTTYEGLLTGANETGALTIVIEKAGLLGGAKKGSPATGTSSTATGSVGMASGTVSLTGSVDASTNQISMTGTTPNGTYTLTATVTATGFSGTYTGPNGSGVFQVSATSNGGTVKVWCGTYSGDASGVWNVFVTDTGDAFGAHCEDAGCDALGGTVTGTTMKLGDKKSPNSASGTISGANVSGTWASADGSQHGTWTGASDSCPAFAPVGGSSSGGTTAPLKLSVPIAQELTDAFAFDFNETGFYFFTSSEIHACAAGANCFTGGTKLVGPLAVPSSLAISGTTLFFTHDFDEIDSCDVSGNSCSPTTFLATGASTYPNQLTVANGNLYFTTQNSGVTRVSACPLTGCGAGPTTVMDAAPALSGLATTGLVVGAGTLYLETFQGPAFSFAMSDALTADPASGAQVHDGGWASADLWSDGSSLYFANTTGALVTCALPGCATTSTVTSQNMTIGSPASLRADAKNFYVLDRGTPNGSGGTNPKTGQLISIPR